MSKEELDMSNNFTNHFSADDAALVLIDFQPQMFMVSRATTATRWQCEADRPRSARSPHWPPTTAAPLMPRRPGKRKKSRIRPWPSRLLIWGWQRWKNLL